MAKKKTTKKKPGSKKAANKKPIRTIVVKKKASVKRSKKKAPKKPKTKKAARAPLPDDAARQYFRELVRSPELAYADAQAVFKKWRAKILKIPGVLSADVGMKIQGPNSTREFAICIYVREKRPLTDLPLAEQIKEYYDGIPTDVQTCKYRLCASSVRPEGGDPIQAALFGTLGFGVMSDSDNLERYLTCTHVVSNSNSVTSPVTVNDDNGIPIGTVSTDPDFDWVYSNRLDCALIRPPEPQSSRVTIPRAGSLNPFNMRRPRLSDMSRELVVWKWGAVTHETRGIIVGIDAFVPIEEQDGSIRITENQIKVVSKTTNLFAQQGDSGAILCVENDAIGILRAVGCDEQGRSFAVACPLRRSNQQGAADKLKFSL